MSKRSCPDIRVGCTLDQIAQRTAYWRDVINIKATDRLAKPAPMYRP
ncbi:hypothetical protein U5897_15825 [Acinetobacter baumannii]|nr:hypothetical protein [Acinetobacter baumannii]WSI12824.1 hypothetical protein U5897_15825 [Acinetobacter baumannii]